MSKQTTEQIKQLMGRIWYDRIIEQSTHEYHAKPVIRENHTLKEYLTMRIHEKYVLESRDIVKRWNQL